MTEKRNLPVSSEEKVINEAQAFLADNQATFTQSAKATEREPFKEPGKQIFYILAGIALLILAVAFGMWISKPLAIDKFGSGTDTPMTRTSRFAPGVQRVAERDLPIHAYDSYGGVTVEVTHASIKSRYTNIDVSVTNESHEPVSFLGIMNAQLIDEWGNVLYADISTAEGFIEINPYSTATKTVRFEGPVHPDAKTLTLVINRVGTLKERWYHEITFGI